MRNYKYSPIVNRNEKAVQSRNILLKRNYARRKGTRGLDERERELISKIETQMLTSSITAFGETLATAIENLLIRIADKINDISLFCEMHNLNMGKIG